MLVNLIGNAIKFTPEHGSIHISASEFQDEIRVSVLDSGSGIDTHDIERIFEPFVQVGRRDGPGSKGTGLGLPISRRIIELHQGKLEVRSDYGQGSCFEFSIPIYQEGADLVAFIEDLKNSAKNTVHLFMVRVHPEQTNLSISQSILSDFQHTASQTLRRSTDQVFIDAGKRHLAIIVEGDKQTANGALSRVLENFPKGLSDCRFELGECSIQGVVDDSQSVISNASNFKPLSQKVL